MTDDLLSMERYVGPVRFYVICHFYWIIYRFLKYLVALPLWQV